MARSNIILILYMAAIIAITVGLETIFHIGFLCYLLYRIEYPPNAEMLMIGPSAPYPDIQLATPKEHEHTF